MPDQLQRLKAALAGRYAVAREVGSGGMATVYLAEDLRHHRQVAIKALRPELAAALGPERFLREIEIAARLQHPNILALHDSGDADGLLYYVMPYVEGPSLRDKLTNEGELPVDDAIRILRDVVDALTEAHANGVVHRDIKPENILLSGRHALVTDFGVAKAVSEATGREKLTTAGVTLGTPAYMAPEQAAADPHLDHRVDIYAVGAVAYEALTGRPVFMGGTPQMVLSAHLAEVPVPVTRYRETVPLVLESIVMRCLEKRPADRWQSADELLRQIEAVSEGTTVLRTPGQEASKLGAHLVRVSALFGALAVAVLGVVYALVIQLGLPDWVFMAAVAVLALALPATLLTGYHERQRGLIRSRGSPAAATTWLARWVRWRVTLGAGASALALLGVVTVGYMAMRQLGIGPLATLVASGVLDEGESVILADFTDRTGDSLLATTFTEAFRVDLTQSTTVSLVSMSRLGDALRRMERDPHAPFPDDVARELAMREGVTAIVAGEINRAGAGYVLTVRVLSAEDGEVLAAVRETANDSTEIISAIDRLSKQLRRRIGESLRSVRAAPRLSEATTASLPALRKYSQAERARVRGDTYRAIGLLQDATKLDTTFAEAYRMLAIELGNEGIRRRLEVDALSRAFEYRHKLPDDRRYNVEGSYYGNLAKDPFKAIEAYRAQLDVDPQATDAMTNIGTQYFRMRDFERADEWFAQAIRSDSTYPLHYYNRIGTLINLGRLDSARAALKQLEAVAPQHPYALLYRANLAHQAGDYDSVLAALGELGRSNDLRWRLISLEARAWSAALRGSVANAQRLFGSEVEMLASAGLWPQAIQATVSSAELKLGLLEERDAAIARVDSAQHRFPLDSIDPLERPYLDLAAFYARAGELVRARALVAEFDANVPAELRTPDRRSERERVLGLVELEAGRASAALEHLELSDVGGCVVCALPDLAHAYDAAGDVDSVVRITERYVQRPDNFRASIDWLELAAAHKRLGELYDQRGEREQAIRHYDEFLELWRDADPVLQPIVDDVRARVARLIGERQG